MVEISYNLYLPEIQANFSALHDFSRMRRHKGRDQAQHDVVLCRSKVRR